MLVLISGISASGKNTIISKLLERHSDWGGYTSYTTKQKFNRAIDNDDEGYYYITHEEFEKKIQNGDFLEYAVVHGGNYYGSGKKEVEEAMNKYSVVINDLDVIGTQKIKESDIDAISIFINVSDDEELKRRLSLRGDSKDDVLVRLSRASMEREYSKKYDYIVDNIELEKCVNQVDNIILNELKKRSK